MPEHFSVSLPATSSKGKRYRRQKDCHILYRRETTGGKKDENRLALSAVARLRPSSNLRIESSAVLERTYGTGDIK